MDVNDSDWKLNLNDFQDKEFLNNYITAHNLTEEETKWLDKVFNWIIWGNVSAYVVVSNIFLLIYNGLNYIVLGITIGFGIMWFLSLIRYFVVWKKYKSHKTKVTAKLFMVISKMHYDIEKIKTEIKEK